jgi:hypothetical protein
MANKVQVSWSWSSVLINLTLSSVVISCSSIQSWLPKPGVISCELLGGASTWDQASWVWEANANELQCGPRPVSVTGCSQWNGRYFNFIVTFFLWFVMMKWINIKLCMYRGHYNCFWACLHGVEFVLATDRILVVWIGRLKTISLSLFSASWKNVLTRSSVVLLEWYNLKNLEQKVYWGLQWKPVSFSACHLRCQFSNSLPLVSSVIFGSWIGPWSSPWIETMVEQC